MYSQMETINSKVVESPSSFTPINYLSELLLPEILFHLCSYIDPWSLCFLSETSTALSKSAREDKVWANKLEKHFPTEVITTPPFQLFATTAQAKYAHKTREIKELCSLICGNDIYSIHNMKVPFDLVLMSIGHNQKFDLEYLQNFSRQFHNSPILIKHGDECLIYGFTDKNGQDRDCNGHKWDITPLNPEHFNHLTFPVGGQTTKLLQHSITTSMRQEIRDKNGHNQYLEITKTLLEQKVSNQTVLDLIRKQHNPDLNDYIFKQLVETDTTVLLDYGIQLDQSDGIFESLLLNEKNINELEIDKRSLLYHAVLLNSIHSTKTLLDLKAEPNKGTSECSPLYKAAQEGYLDIVKLLVFYGADKEYKLGDERFTSIFVAAQRGNLEVVKFLYEKGANINARCINGCNPLYLAAQEGKVEVCDFLLSVGAELLITYRSAFTPLYAAANKGHVRVIEKFLAHAKQISPTFLKKLIEAGGAEGSTALYIAAQNGFHEVCQALLEKGANVDALFRGHSPLYMSSQKGHTEVVNTLLRFNPNINRICANQTTALYVATQNNFPAIVDALLSNGADATIGYLEDYTPLYVACQKGHLAIVEIMLQRDIAIDTQTIKGATALYVATKNGHPKIVSLLLAKHADYHIAYKNGNTPLHIACDGLTVGDDDTNQKYLDIIILLLTAGADVSLKNNDGATPIECISDSKLRRQVEKSVKQMQLQKSTIHTAARDGRLTELVNLISSGVDINLQLINGKTALYIAVQNKQVDIVKFLLKQGANPELSHKTYTPLQMACRIDEPTIRLRMIKLLINAGANPLALDLNHQTPNNQTSDETIQNLMQFLEKMSQLTEPTEPNHTATIFEINPVLRQIESFISQPAKEQLFASTKDIPSKEQAIFIANRLTKTHNPLTHAILLYVLLNKANRDGLIRLVTNELANQSIIPAKPWLYNFMFKWLGKNIQLFEDFKKMIIQPIQQNLDYPHEHPSHAFQSALICLRFIETKFALAPEPSTSFIPSERI